MFAPDIGVGGLGGVKGAVLVVPIAEINYGFCR